MHLARVLSFSFIDEKGLPLDGGKVFVYLSDSTEDVDTYSDPEGKNLNSNPVILNSRGCASIYIDISKSYRFIVKDTKGNVNWFADKYTVIGGSEAVLEEVDKRIVSSVEEVMRAVELERQTRENLCDALDSRISKLESLYL